MPGTQWTLKKGFISTSWEARTGSHSFHVQVSEHLQFYRRSQMLVYTFHLFFFFFPSWSKRELKPDGVDILQLQTYKFSYFF